MDGRQVTENKLKRDDINTATDAPADGAVACLSLTDSQTDKL